MNDVTRNLAYAYLIAMFNDNFYDMNIIIVIHLSNYSSHFCYTLLQLLLYMSKQEKVSWKIEICHNGSI